MFKFDIFNRPEPATLYLCKPDDTIVCELNGIDESSASLTINLNNQYELSFDYDRYINTPDGELIESNGYHSLCIGMKILIDDVGYFTMKYPPLSYDGTKESKSITANSIDSELENKDLVGFKINTGESDSLEYLVTYDDDETETLLNAYTGLPYDYIVFDNTYPEQLETLLNKYSDGTTITDSDAIAEIVSYCSLTPRLKSRVETAEDGTMSLTEYVEYTYDEDGENVISIYLFEGYNARISQLIEFYAKYHDQLSLISLAIENCSCDWSIGEIDPSLVNKKFQFDVDGENIYSFLTSDVASTAYCVFSFDLFNREINAILVENIGVDSGVIIDKKNLMTSLEISCDEENLYTRYNVSGGNDITLSYVNFGYKRIDDITYFLNARDENGKLIYMSETLRTKYYQFMADREAAREYYIDYTKQYNQLLIDIDETKYRVPNDEVKTDWDTFTNDELDAALTTYNQLLVTLISLYKEDYGVAGCDSDGSVNENYIRNTEYWYDYYAYQQAIEQIEATIIARANDSTYADIDDEKTLAIISAWETEWSLYGTVELQSKITAYNNSMQVLVDDESVILKDNSEEAKTWDELTSDEKTEYGYLEVNYHYAEYTELYEYRQSCQAYLDTLLTELAEKESQLDQIQADRTALVSLVTVSGYNRTALGKLVTLETVSGAADSFTDAEIKTINRLYIDGNYSNGNILTTSLDTTVTEVEVQRELLEDAKEQLSIDSQPQISFSTELDNLLAMPEFKNFDFTVGNYVTVEYYDDYYVTLRLASMTFNPCIPEDSLSVTFTNYTRSNAERSDLSYILGQATGGSSSSGGSSGGSSSSFGDSDDIDVTLSNTMLTKLLNTEMFGTRVSNIILDTINANSITAKYATFNGLAKGTTIVDGKCIVTGYIIDSAYNGTNGAINNTSGSIINLETGQFSFAGGNLIWDGSTLTVEGTINTTAGTIGGWTITDSDIYDATSSNYSAGIGKYGGRYAFWAGTTFDNATNAPFRVGHDGSLTATNAYIEGTVNATSGSFTGSVTATSLVATTSGQIANWTFDGSRMYDTIGYNTYAQSAGVNAYGSGMAFWAGGNDLTGNSAPFRVDHSGYAYMSNATIGGWTITSDMIYNGIALTGGQDTNSVGMCSTNTDWAFWAGNGRYRVSHDGYLYANNADISGTITATSGSFTGSIYAGSGTIAGWTIGSYKIYNAGYESYGTAVMQMPTADTTYVFAAGGSNHSSYTDCPFRVDKAGKLYSSTAEINGSVYIGGKVEIYGDVIIYNGVTIYEPAALYDTVDIYGSTTFYDSATFYDSTTFYGVNYLLGRIYVDDAYNNASSSSTANARLTDVNSTGYSHLAKTASSSIRYKNSICEVDANDVELLFDIPVHWFTYKDGYLEDEDERLGVSVPGFFVEDWDEVCPIAIDHVNGVAEMWNPNIVVPLMFEMIKSDHELYTTSESRMEALEQQLIDAQIRIAELENQLSA